MRVAAIDIGSNSIHIIIARVGEQGVIEIIDRDKATVRLGSGTLSGGEMGEDAMARGLEALTHFARLARSHGVDTIEAVATSAVREARNGGAFMERVKEATNIPVRIIAGPEEARLIWLGAREVIDFRGRKALVVDVGGGSVEFILGDQERILEACSLKLGVIRLQEGFLRADPLSKDDRQALETFILKQASPLFKRLKAKGLELAVGSSGTMVSLITAAAGLTQEGASGIQASRGQLQALCQKLMTLPRAERLKLPGIDPRRVDTLVPGAVLTNLLLEKLDLEGFLACDRALREGLVVDYVERHRPGIRLLDAVPDLRRRSVIQLASRCGAFNLHGLQVARLSTTLFDLLAPLHALEGLERELLHFAGLLIDIGYLIDAEDHHKHGYYLIKNGRLDGFSSREIDILAAVVRYHRKALPKARHESLEPLSNADRGRVSLMAGILRLAATLDRSRARAVRALGCRISKGAVEIFFLPQEDGALELWTASRRTELLEVALKRSVSVARLFSPDEQPDIRWLPVEEKTLDPEALLALGGGSLSAPGLPIGPVSPLVV